MYTYHLIIMAYKFWVDTRRPNQPLVHMRSSYSKQVKVYTVAALLQWLITDEPLNQAKDYKDLVGIVSLNQILEVNCHSSHGNELASYLVANRVELVNLYNLHIPSTSSLEITTVQVMPNKVYLVFNRAVDPGFVSFLEVKLRSEIKGISPNFHYEGKESNNSLAS